MLLKLAHASIRVGDMERSKEFYGDVLGLKHVNDEETERLKFSFFQIGDTEIELIQVKSETLEPRKTGSIDHIAFFVEDIEREVERLKKLQVKFLTEEIREALVYKMIFMEGPDGERIELMERVK